jgi:hypothetical protein
MGRGGSLKGRAGKGRRAVRALMSVVSRHKCRREGRVESDKMG